jgi:hypothetical protein
VPVVGAKGARVPGALRARKCALLNYDALDH